MTEELKAEGLPRRPLRNHPDPDAIGLQLLGSRRPRENHRARGAHRRRRGAAEAAGPRQWCCTSRMSRSRCSSIAVLRPAKHAHGAGVVSGGGHALGLAAGARGRRRASIAFRVKVEPFDRGSRAAASSRSSARRIARATGTKDCFASVIRSVSASSCIRVEARQSDRAMILTTEVISRRAVPARSRRRAGLPLLNR